MITPTIGRQVWFRGIPYDVWARNPGLTPSVNGNDQPMAATVVYVWGDRMVNIDVIDHNGVHWFMSSVTLRQPEDDVPASSYVEWMPYQVGQAQSVAKVYPEPSANQP